MGGFQKIRRPADPGPSWVPQKPTLRWPTLRRGRKFPAGWLATAKLKDERPCRHVLRRKAKADPSGCCSGQSPLILRGWLGGVDNENFTEPFLNFQFNTHLIRKR